MRSLLIVSMIATAVLVATARADIYKCVDSSGGVGFSDKPCNTLESGGAVSIRVPLANSAPKGRSHHDEATDQLLSIDIPALEREAQRDMDSSDAATKKRGRDLAVLARQQKLAAEALRAAKAEQAATAQKYQEAIDRFSR